MSDDKESQKPEVRSKEWSEIIAEQFSSLAWIKGLKIYLSIIGVLGLGAYLAIHDFFCGTIWRYTICPDGTNTEESGSCESN